MGTLILFAIPGAGLLGQFAYGYLDHLRFQRFHDEVTKLGGRAENAEFEGISFTINAIDVDLSGTATGDADLQRLARDPMFKRVTNLSLAGTRITDKGVPALNSIPWFLYLDLSKTGITDQGMESISGCRIIRIKLSGTRVSDATIDLLKRQAATGREMYEVDLTDTRVTEGELRRLADLYPSMSIKYGSSLAPKRTQ